MDSENDENFEDYKYFKGFINFSSHVQKGESLWLIELACKKAEENNESVVMFTIPSDDDTLITTGEIEEFLQKKFKIKK